MENLGIRVLFEGINILMLLGGLLVTAEIAFTSILIGSVLGVAIGISRTLGIKAVALVNRIYLEAFRIIPILVWLYVVYFGITTALDLHLSGEAAAIIVFSLWGAAELGDIVRGAMESLPRHQIESGRAIGLGRFELYRYILIPQAIRRMLPGAINLSTRMIKTTSLVVLIGVVDVVKVGQQIIEVSRFKTPAASFWVYGCIFILYFIICWPLSKISKRLEAKWNG